MKTAISLPDELFRRADTLATELGISRSALYATAVAEFVAKHRATDITARLDQVYGDTASTLEKPLRRAQGKTLAKDTW